MWSCRWLPGAIISTRRAGMRYLDRLEPREPYRQLRYRCFDGTATSATSPNWANAALPSFQRGSPRVSTKRPLPVLARNSEARFVRSLPVSAAADGTFKLGHGDAVPPSALGKATLIQPFLPSISTKANIRSAMIFGGSLQPRDRQAPQGGRLSVQLAPGRHPNRGANRRKARSSWRKAALAAAPAEAAYARVDMVRDADGELAVIELELIEPALWLQHAADGGASFATAILERLGAE